MNKYDVFFIALACWLLGACAPIPTPQPAAAPTPIAPTAAPVPSATVAPRATTAAATVPVPASPAPSLTRPPSSTATTTAPGFAVKLLATFNGDPDRFKQPWRIAVDATNHLYVVEGAEVRKYDPNTKAWARWGSQVQGGFAVALAVDGQSNVYVTGGGNQGVQKFDSSGKLQTQWGGSGSGKGQFNGPDDVAVDAQGNVFVLDTSNYRVQKFDGGGKFVTSWGSQGSQDGQFNHLSALGVDAQGNVYVGDRQGAYSRVSKFDNTGKFLLKLTTCGEGLNIVAASAIAADQANRVYVADGNGGRICTFDGQGNFVATWKSEAGNPTSQLGFPWGLAIDRAGNIYVSDQSSKTVREFQLK